MQSKNLVQKFAFTKADLYIAWTLALNDVKHAYKRSTFGPFWFTISMTIQIVVMGLVFGLIFKLSLSDYFPYITASMIIWSFIATAVSDGSQSLIVSEGIIRQIKINYSIFAIRSVIKNLLLLAHNAPVVLLVLIVFGKISFFNLLFAPGLIILTGNLIWISILTGMLSARFRDMAPIISSGMTILYFLSPIMWMPESLGDSNLAHFLLGLNPLYHLLQVVREPLLGDVPTFENYAASLAILAIGALFTSIIFKKFKNEIPFWV